jgi:hypothetical protein
MSERLFPSERLAIACALNAHLVNVNQRETDMSSIRSGRLGLLFVGLLGLLSIFSASASAAGAPIVTGTPASSRTLNGATLNGTVNPNGASTTYKFEWGETTGYGNSTSKVSAGSGTSAVPVSATLKGLEPGKTYHYRVSATNSFGTTVSEDVAFEPLQWRVEGKPALEYPKGLNGKVIWNSVYFDWTLTGEGSTNGGTAVKVTCAPVTREGGAYGDLTAYFHFPYNGCTVSLNGVVSKKCASTYPELKLNASLVPTVGANIYMGETCPIGENLPLGTFGISLGSASELAEQEVTLTSQSGFGSVAFTIKGTWSLGAPYNGWKFGIS